MRVLILHNRYRSNSARGENVVVAEELDELRRPRDPETSERLAGLGYLFYERFTNEGMPSGEFADFVSTFQAQLAIYNEPNSTIRRRVATGLSTRWAFGVAATAPKWLRNSSNVRQSGSGRTALAVTWMRWPSGGRSLEKHGSVTVNGPQRVRPTDSESSCIA
jgi:hypothetical protein